MMPADGSQLTIREYCASFGKLKAAIAIIVGTLPYISKLFPDRISPYLFPPLGTMEGVARVGTVVLSVAATFCVYFILRGSKSYSFKMWFSVLLAVSLVSFFFYAGVFGRYVKFVEIPAQQKQVAVSVGYKRSDFAVTTFPGSTDYEMLRARGPIEEEIQRLWTAWRPYDLECWPLTRSSCALSSAC